MKRRILGAIAVFAIAALPAMGAGAHADHSADAKEDRCDTWYREGHETGTGNNKSSHHHEDEFDNGEVVPGSGVYVHNHTGHYVIRGEGFYVEVIGGGGFNRNGNQGGAFQGEVDPGNGAPDVDFHGNTFAGANSPDGLPAHAEGTGCISVMDNKIGDEGELP